MKHRERFRTVISKLCQLHATVATRRNQRGATAVEYAILASLIAAVIATTVGALGIGVNELFTSIEIP
jgi:Flp pilus assembly pilin Flp